MSGIKLNELQTSKHINLNCSAVHFITKYVEY